MITLGLSAISKGEQECLYLGNLNALRDWGHARDYVEAMWLMLQQKKPIDLVISTGKQSTVTVSYTHLTLPTNREV